MATFNFQSAEQLKTMPAEQRNQYLYWLAGNGQGYDPSGHGGSLVNLANQGQWGEIAYQLPFMQGEIQKFADRGVEYAQRAKEYVTNGLTDGAVPTWIAQAKSYLENMAKQYAAAPSFVKGEAPQTYDQIYASVAAVNPYDTKGGVVYDKEQAAKAAAAGPGAGGNGTNGQGMTPEQMSTVAGASGSNAADVDQTGWTDSMKQSYAAMQGYVEKITSNGQIVNPDIKIDDAMIQRFTNQAKTELGSYYGQIFNQADQDLKTAAESISQGYAKNARDIGLQYGNQLENKQEDLAARGLGLGQFRDQEEKKIADAAGRSLQDATDAATEAARKVGTAGERELGSAKIGSFNPSITTGQSLQLGAPGQYGLTGGNGTRSLFSATGNTTGTLQADQLNAEESRKQELINNERGLRALNYA